MAKSKEVVKSNEELVLDNYQKLGASLSKMEVGEDITVEEFYEFEEGEEARFVVIGLQKIKSKNSEERIDAIKAVTEEGKVVLLADVVCRTNLFEIASSGNPTPIQVRCIGIEKGANGKYKKLKINKLN